MASTEAKTYALIFRTHFWDAFVEEQFERMSRGLKRGDVYVLVDETNGPVPGINHDRIFSVKSKQILDDGFAAAGEGILLWFNGDYPLYAFRAAHPEYDYYLQAEYDVNLNLNLDDWIARIADEGTDFVGLTKGDQTEAWYWADTCRDCYSPEQVRHQLICVSVFSGRALDFLRKRRLEMSDQFRSGAIRRWPMCEAFIPTELATAGFRLEELSSYGKTAAYDHWPPFLPGVAAKMSDVEFIHPVLNRDRYVASIMNYHVGVEGYLNPFSLMHRKLRKLPLGSYLKVLAQTLTAKIKRNAKLRTMRHVVRRETL